MANVPIVTEKTYSEMAALIAAGELNLALSYLITDRGDNGLLFRAAAPNRLENDGLRYMLCPATYATGADAYENDWIGVWNATKGATATEGQLTIWNGLVWVAGAVLSGDSPSTENSGWTVIPKASFTNHEYVEMIFGVTYDFAEDWINKQWDSKGNEFVANKASEMDDQGMPTPINLIDYCDWNYDTSGNLFVENKLVYCYNNSNNGIIAYNNGYFRIYNNSNGGGIDRNKCGLGIYGNTNNGDISNNMGDAIYNNSNGGGITNNTGNVFGNSNTMSITYNDCVQIYTNSNIGSITYNNIGNYSIYQNTNNGNIANNNNHGDIYSNSSLPETTVNIQFNDNNGAITGVWDADVTDPVVDKTGTAV